jgi:hypothetical protein
LVAAQELILEECFWLFKSVKENRRLVTLEIYRVQFGQVQGVKGVSRLTGNVGIGSIGLEPHPDRDAQFS